MFIMCTVTYSVWWGVPRSVTCQMVYVYVYVYMYMYVGETHVHSVHMYFSCFRVTIWIYK